MGKFDERAQGWSAMFRATSRAPAAYHGIKNKTSLTPKFRPIRRNLHANFRSQISWVTSFRKCESLHSTVKNAILSKAQYTILDNTSPANHTFVHELFIVEWNLHFRSTFSRDEALKGNRGKSFVRQNQLENIHHFTCRGPEVLGLCTFLEIGPTSSAFYAEDLELWKSCVLSKRDLIPFQHVSPAASRASRLHPGRKDVEKTITKIEHRWVSSFLIRLD